MAIIDFWTTNLNPIILAGGYLTVEPEKRQYKKDDRKTYTVEDLSNNPEYIAVKDAAKRLGIGCKMLKNNIIASGIEYRTFSNKGKLYYLVSDVNQADHKPKGKQPIPDIYISGVELRELKGWTPYELWDNANKNKWVKKRFTGITTYYLKSEVL